MQDSESDTIILQTWPEKIVDMLKAIGVESKPIDVGTLDIERADYYSRYFSQTPRMVTNRGCVEVEGTNIDLIQIIQKG